MRTLYLLTGTNSSVPTDLVLRLERLSRSAGREDLFRRQMPGILDQLIYQAKIESVTASSAMEGVDVARPRADLIIGGQAKQLRTRNEKELAGYRDALGYSFCEPSQGLSVGLICHFHRLLYAHTDARGGNLKADDNIVVERDPVSHERMVRFVPVSAAETPQTLAAAVDTYAESEALPPIVRIGAFILDFLVIHPFADGNGRVARVLTNHLAIQCGFGVSHYVSIEKLIQDRSDEYYAALLASTHGWHESQHDPWPWITFLTEVFVAAYEIFESFASDASSKRTKQDRVRDFVLHRDTASFSVRDVVHALPGVSDHTVRLVLKQLAHDGLVKADGVGRGARWIRL